MTLVITGEATENDTTHKQSSQGTGVLATDHFGVGSWCPGDDVLI